jgi:Putative Flp pilus-assembly TadE/G-like
VRDTTVINEPHVVAPLRERLRSERGVSLIMVAIEILMLTGFTAFVLDYGLMWLGRRQAQNAADAAALAGAISRAYDEPVATPPPTGISYQAAVAAANLNQVIGQPGGVAVLFECPAFAAGGRCVRADVHRDGTDANGDGTTDSTPLPTFFARIWGIANQNVRATATAWVSYGNTTNCMRPFSVVDKWNDIVNPALNPKKFERWKNVGPSLVQLNPKDIYDPPTNTSAGTGYTPTFDLGTQVFLKRGNPSASADNVEPGWSLPVQLPDPDGGYFSGANDYNGAIKHCIGAPVSIGDYLPTETGVMQGPTKQGVQTDADSLVNQDPTATWNPSTMTITGSCAPGPCGSFSPRIVPISVFDMDEYQWRVTANDWTHEWIPDVGPGPGAFSCPIGGRCVRVTNILGFFVQSVTNGGDVTGRIMMLPGELLTGSSTVAPSASFVTNIQLIR